MKVETHHLNIKIIELPDSFTFVNLAHEGNPDCAYENIESYTGKPMSITVAKRDTKSNNITMSRALSEAVKVLF